MVGFRSRGSTNTVSNREADSDGNYRNLYSKCCPTPNIRLGELRKILRSIVERFKR